MLSDGVSLHYSRQNIPLIERVKRSMISHLTEILFIKCKVLLR